MGATAEEEKFVSHSLYDVIGVSPTATKEQIEASCLRLAKEFNPASRPGDVLTEVRFKEIELAFEILGDADKRRLYDAELQQAHIAAPSVHPMKQKGEFSVHSLTRRMYRGIKDSSKMKWGLVAAVVVVMGASVPYGMSAYQERQEIDKRAKLFLAEKELNATATELLLEAVKNHLKDPNSAQFSNLYEGHSVDGRRHEVCGAVNAKNSFGGYIGFRRFVATIVAGDDGSFGAASVSVSIQPVESYMAASFDLVWKRSTCG